MKLISFVQSALDRARALDFIAPLAIRLYLLPIFYEGAHAKITGFAALVQWFGGTRRPQYAGTAVDGIACDSH